MEPDDYVESNGDSSIDDDDDDFENDDLEADHFQDDNRSHRTAKPAGKPRKPPQASSLAPPKKKWQQQLAWAGEAEPEEEPPVLAADGQTREIWYVLDALSGQNISKPVLLLYQREARSTGKLGKLKQFSLRPYDIDRLVTGDDAEILKLLLGYQSVDDDDYGYGYLLAPRLGGRCCPRAQSSSSCRSWPPRAGWRGSSPPGGSNPNRKNLRPLAWDDGPPWRFRLDIARDDQRQQWVLSGQLYREGGASACRWKRPRGSSSRASSSSTTAIGAAGDRRHRRG